MAKTRKYLHAFSGGEISPEMIGRIDDVRHQTGAARMLNMFAKPHGPCQRRPGFERVADCYKTANSATRVLPFRFSDTQSAVIEAGYDTTLGHGYFRFHSGGDPVTFTVNPGGDPIATEVVQVFRPAVDAVLFAPVAKAAFTVLPVVDTSDDSDINVGTDEFTLTAHPFETGAPIGIASTGAFPSVVGTALNTTTVYYAIDKGANTISIARTYADAIATTAIDITVNTGGATLYWGHAEHLQDGDAVRIDNPSGSTPDGLDEDTTYYAKNNGSVLGYSLYHSREGAVNGWSTDLANATTAIAFAAAVTYTNGLLRRYRSGELVEAVRGGGAYYTAREEFSSDGPWAVAEWLAQEVDNIYTIESPFTAASLFEINTVQANDIMSMAHADVGKYELRRQATTWWEVAAIELTAVLRAPENITVTADTGRRARIHAVYNVFPVSGGVYNARFYVGLGVASEETLLTDIPIVPSDEIWLNVPGYTIDRTTQGGTATDPIDGPYIVKDTTFSGQENRFDIMHPEDMLPVRVEDVIGTTVSPYGYVDLVPLGELRDNYYVVTAVSDSDLESAPSSEGTVENNLYSLGASNTITWSAVANAASYRVYKKKNGVFGLIGAVKATEALEFRDDNIAPDLGLTPPISDDTLTTAPGVAGYFEQRRVFAATETQPQQVWMTRSGTNSDLSYHLPLQDSDRISFVLASRQGETIRHLLPLDHLLIMTDHTEYRVTPINNDAITPTTLAVRPQSFVGSNFIAPLVVGRTVLFGAARGGHVFEMNYQRSAAGFIPADVSVRATHLFDELTLRDAALQKSPYQIAWWTSSNGSLLGFTYVPEQQVGGWHEHTTDGTFESVCVVPEGDEDRVYAVVLRGSTRRIERMGEMKHDSLEESMFVDSAVVYDGVATTTITGLDHLDGETVSVLADGVVTTAVPASGSITLASPASKVSIGLPFTSRLTTLPLLVQIDGHGQGRTKNVNNVHVRVRESGVFSAGPEGGTLRPSDSKANAIRGKLVTDPLVTDSVRVPITGNWDDDGAVTVETALPLPLNVLGMTLEVEIGG